MNPYVMGFVAGVVSTLFCMFCFEAMVKDSKVSEEKHSPDYAEKYKSERMEGVPCANYRCKRGFDEKYEMNCRLTISGDPFAVGCDMYFPLRESELERKSR